MNYKQLPVFILVVLFSAVAFADVYKWTDNKGITHYTQYKPTDYPSVLVKGAAPEAADAEDLNAPFAKQIDERAKARKEQEASKKAQAGEGDFNAQQCATAKSNLNALQAEGRVSYVNSAGETIFMDDSEKQSRIGEAQKQIEFYCN